jgi:hypothetical protein
VRKDYLDIPAVAEKNDVPPLPVLQGAVADGIEFL